VAETPVECVCGSLCVHGVLCVSGIGRHTALALARRGAKVTAVTRTQADLDSLLQEVLRSLLDLNVHVVAVVEISCA